LAGKDLTELEQQAIEASEEMRKKDGELQESSGTETNAETATSGVSLSAAPEPPAKEGDSEDPKKDGAEDAEADDDDDDDDDKAPAEAPAPKPVSSDIAAIFEDDDTVYLGLHVYTTNGAKSTVNGQLRHEMGVGFGGLAVSGLPGNE
jgi:hypothetical protein